MIIKVKELEITSLFLQMEIAGTICSELVVISCIRLYSIQFNSIQICLFSLKLLNTQGSHLK